MSNRSSKTPLMRELFVCYRKKNRYQEDSSTELMPLFEKRADKSPPVANKREHFQPFAEL